MKRKRVGILISGRGSNMAALVEAARDPAYPAEIVCVISNRPEAPGLKFAQDRNIPTHIIDNKNFGTREAFDASLNDYLQSQKLDLIACAGFMRIMTSVLLEPWAGKMINIHPSLLPLYKGTHTHERALADGVKVHGCSVHYVTEELDGGPVIAQSEVPVLAGDTPETLSARVLVEEHKLYPKALAMVAKKISQTL
ncbi:MAG: phosphoribosylglycinamide formyltransferase [Aestuariivirga sp.]